MLELSLSLVLSILKTKNYFLLVGSNSSKFELVFDHEFWKKGAIGAFSFSSLICGTVQLVWRSGEK